MDVLIVTGMSGAGKSQAMVALEDIGYYCVDNVPPALISKFAELSSHTGGQIEKMALSVDIRSRGSFSSLSEKLTELKSIGYTVKVLFLDCNDAVLLTRYKETRRRHPLDAKEYLSTLHAIESERILLADSRMQADDIIDTSLLSAGQLRDFIRRRYLSEGKNSPMSVRVSSFGFKFGTPQDADLLFDVRCLKNPYYETTLRPLTGLDGVVEEFVLRFEDAKILLGKLEDLLDFLIPLYIAEGKTNLVISFGCTGGKHRSVVFAEQISAYLSDRQHEVATLHRDIQRE